MVDRYWGGDEARVTRAGHECEDTISNGTTSTPTLSALPPRPGWAVRTSTGLISSPATPPPTLSSSSVSSLFTSSSSSSTASLHGVQRSEWADCSSVLPSSSSPSSIRSTTSGVRQQISASTSGKINEQPPLVSSVSGANLSTLTVPVHTIHHTAQSTGCLPERLEVKEVQMSGQNGLLARPSSSSGSSSGSPNINPSSFNNLPTRVHGHDHTRPLPPPRLPETISTIAPLTAPLTPLSTSSSFRTNSRLQSINTAGTTTNSSDSNTQHLRNDRTLGEVTLTVPRPDVERIVNEYVETPFRQPTSQKCLKNERRQQHNQFHHHRHHHHHHHQSTPQNQQIQLHQQQQLQQQRQQKQQRSQLQQLSNDQQVQQQHQQQQQKQQQQQQQVEQESTETRSARRLQNHLLQSSPGQPITKQPVSFTKEPATTGSGSLGRPNDSSLSIMCDYCGRCKCESCREPPPLPSRWLCNNSCFCSAETALDYASCLCCVKGLFYHCGDANGSGDSEVGGSCADEPCSCSGSRKTARWTCLAALTMVLPCLLCYWPLKGCVTICEACYARHAAQGCKCDPMAVGRSFGGPPGTLIVSRDSRDPEKRLLDPVTPDL
ncbi:GSCOCG00011162001-RA-CDS [Cotesia congregata]|nr:GSCOCG00011162001-RA-CDS [Cotesia congregata]